MSAYIWWKTIGNANGLLSASGELQRRAYVMAQFSRFAHPGDVRIGVSANSSTLGISAFRNQDSSRFAIIAVNNSAASVTHTFNVNGISATSITPVITSATQSLEVQAPVFLDGSAFTYTVPAFSIVSFTLESSSPIQVKRGGFVLNRRTARIVQQITVTNTSGATVAGPVRVALDQLSGNTTLLNAGGTTAYSPAGNPFVTVASGSLAPGASASFSLEFAASGSGITYSPRVILGPVTP
jgi:hypothetical protein